RRVDDEHLAVAHLAGRRHDLLERLLAGGEDRAGVDHPGSAGDVDGPLVRTVGGVGPVELAGPGGLELVAQRDRIVVVHDPQGLARGQRAELLEDRLVAHARGDRADVEGGHGSSWWGEAVSDILTVITIETCGAVMEGRPANLSPMAAAMAPGGVGSVPPPS